MTGKKDASATTARPHRGARDVATTYSLTLERSGKTIILRESCLKELLETTKMVLEGRETRND